MDADTLSGEVRDLTQGFDQVRARQEELRKASEAVATRFGAFEERQQNSQRSVADSESRAAAVSQTLKDLSAAASEAVQTKRQLTTLKALADGVTQKVAALEQQRDVVERASSEVGRLHELMRDVEAKIRRHEESAKGLSELESRVADLKELHGEVLQRSTEITANHDAVKQADDELRKRLAALRDEVQRAVKRFELENQGRDAVGQRILDLRSGLTGMEGRFKLLEESSRSITDIQSKSDGPATQLEATAETVATPAAAWWTTSTSGCPTSPPSARSSTSGVASFSRGCRGRTSASVHSPLVPMRRRESRSSCRRRSRPSNGRSAASAKSIPP